jgi:hypothetical protein
MDRRGDGRSGTHHCYSISPQSLTLSSSHCMRAWGGDHVSLASVVTPLRVKTAGAFHCDYAVLTTTVFDGCIAYIIDINHVGRPYMLDGRRGWNEPFLKRQPALSGLFHPCTVHMLWKGCKVRLKFKWCLQ